MTDLRGAFALPASQPAKREQAHARQKIWTANMRNLINDQNQPFRYHSSTRVDTARDG
jgi:hypothetical protein